MAGCLGAIELGWAPVDPLDPSMTRMDLRLFENSLQPQPHVLLELEEVLRLVQRGDYDTAVRQCEALLEGHRSSADLQELLGIALALRGDVERGLRHLEESVRINPIQCTAITKIGDIYLARNDIVRAKLQFQKAVAVDPLRRHAHQRLGSLYEREGDLRAAVHHYESGLIGAPADYLGIKVDLGRLYNRLGQFNRTTELLGGWASVNDSNATVQLVLATAWLGLREHASAIAALERARELEPESERIALAWGIALRETGNLEGSLQALAEWARAHPESAVAHYQMAETLLALQRFPQALERYSMTAKLTPDTTRVRNRIAELYGAMNQVANAIATYESLRSAGRADLRTFDGLATLYQVEGRLEDAERVLEEAAARFKDHPFVYYRLGLFHGFARHYSKAVSNLERAVAMAPHDPRYLMALSAAYARAAQPGAARQTARSLCELVPSDVDVRFYYASLLQDQQAASEAITVYRDILKQHPGHAFSMNNLANLLADSGSLEEAADLALKAAELAPANPAVLHTYGWILARKGKYASALAPLEKAVAAAPNNPTYRYHLAVVQDKRGMREEARKQADAALSLSEDFPDFAAASRLASALRKDSGKPSGSP